MTSLPSNPFNETSGAFSPFSNGLVAVGSSAIGRSWAIVAVERDRVNKADKINGFNNISLLPGCGVSTKESSREGAKAQGKSWFVRRSSARHSS